VGKFLYSPKNADGSRDFTAEDSLAEIESLLSQRWPELANDFVDMNSVPLRKGLSLFLATLLLRHPAHKSRMANAHNKIVAAIDAQPKDAAGNPMVSSVVLGNRELKFDPSEWKHYSSWGEDDFHRGFVRSIQEDTIFIAKILLKKRWSVVYSETPAWVTSDNPFFIISPHLRNYQVGAPAAMAMFPISPTRILCLDELKEPDGQYYPIRAKGESLYNYLTWVNTEGFMVCPRHPDEVLVEIDHLVREEKRRQGLT